MMGQTEIDAQADEAPIGRVQRHPPALPAAALGLGQRVLKIQRGIKRWVRVKRYAFGKTSLFGSSQVKRSKTRV